MLMPDPYLNKRGEMVEKQLIARGIRDERVLNAMRTIPRHQFVSAALAHLAYRDCPLPIGENQTISQPYIVALMTELLQLQGHERVLEVGTGSGYQAAVLCELSAYVYTVERSIILAERAGGLLARLGYNNIDVHVGDGSQGLADMAPFDAIIVTAGAPALPGPLASQLNPNGGRLVIPIGKQSSQYLHCIIREGDNWRTERVLAVRFVPLIGRYGFKFRDDSPEASV